MTSGPLMPKATAVWLVDNTALSFEQIAEFCHLHPLEVKGIADGEVAAGIKGALLIWRLLKFSRHDRAMRRGAFQRSRPSRHHTHDGNISL